MIYMLVVHVSFVWNQRPAMVQLSGFHCRIRIRKDLSCNMQKRCRKDVRTDSYIMLQRPQDLTALGSQIPNT